MLQTDYFFGCSDPLLLSLMIFFQTRQDSKLYLAYVTTPGLRLLPVITLALLGIMFLVAPVSILMIVLLFVCFITSITVGYYYCCCLYTFIAYIAKGYLVF